MIDFQDLVEQYGHSSQYLLDGQTINEQVSEDSNSNTEITESSTFQNAMQLKAEQNESQSIYESERSKLQEFTQSRIFDNICKNPFETRTRS
jgi:hypothetical protein